VATGRTEPREPVRGQWERIESGQSSSHTWSNAADGLIAVSWLEVDSAGAHAYCLSVVLASGARCSGLEAFEALADFAMLAAVQEPYCGTRARVFRLSSGESRP
jgi:hypothetical protein